MCSPHPSLTHTHALSLSLSLYRISLVLYERERKREKELDQILERCVTHALKEREEDCYILLYRSALGPDCDFSATHSHNCRPGTRLQPTPVTCAFNEI